ncbi:MAG: LemA family protein [Pseudomonadota bacterium]
MLTTIGLIVLGAVALLAMWLLGAYNGLVELRQRWRQAYADIDVQLTMRHDLVPNLVETVKGYAKHEKETFERVIQARNGAMNAQGTGEQAAAEGMLTGALNRLMLLVEDYPDLKANEGFQQLQRQLSDIESKIAAARRFFNNVVAEYNTARETFPTVLVASSLGFSHKDFFKVQEADREAVSRAPEVKF